MSQYRAWAYDPQTQQDSARPNSLSAIQSALEKTGSTLPFGNGRSYGDSCLNSDGYVIDSRSLDNIIAFDTEKGVIRCESGVQLNDLLNVIVPRGWFLPVTPGTSFVTIGGALGNDVHGKNHHRDGCFGNHILAFELWRSDGSNIVCTPESNSDLFSATIGGLGLTGFVAWVEFQLLAIDGPEMDVDTLVFHGLDEFIALSNESHATHQYTVAWLDCVAGGKNFGRGIFIRANHSKGKKLTSSKRTALSVPFNFPTWVLNGLSIRCFNELYFHKHRLFSVGESVQPYGSYFYPLDGLLHWNRIYGRTGFFQYQFVVPQSRSEALTDVLKRIVQSKQGSFLAVLKQFGDISSPGMLSFPKEGLCLALDFPNKGTKTLALLSELDEIVVEAGGCVYPAKDNRMSAHSFRNYFPHLTEFKAYIDPAFSSDFWRRVNE